MPIHIAGAVAPAAACPAKVSQRNAPGAMSAMAFIVSPVKPNVGFISTDASAISVFLLRVCRIVYGRFFLLWVLLDESCCELWSHIDVDCSSQIWCGVA